MPWYIDGDEEEDSSPLELCIQDANESVGFNLSPIMMTVLDSDQSESVDINTLVPLPCPCSESTLECHGNTSNERLDCLKNEHKCHPILSSDQRERTSADAHQSATRHIIRGTLAGITVSFIFVAFIISFDSNASLRWASYINHGLKNNVLGLSKGYLARQQGLMVDTQSLTIDGSSRGYRQLREYRPKEDNAIDSLHDLDLDGELVRQFFHRPRSTRIYYSNETFTDRHVNQKSRRKLQSSSISSPSSSSSNIDFSADDVSKKTTITPPKDPQLVVAGKLTVADGPCNVAQMNLKTGEWSLQQRIQLSLYNSYSGGEVYSLLANHTIAINSNAKEYRGEGTSSKGGCVH